MSRDTLALASYLPLVSFGDTFPFPPFPRVSRTFLNGPLVATSLQIQMSVYGLFDLMSVIF